MTTTITTTGTLFVALELGCDKWVLASATQAAEKPRFRTVPARALAKLNEEIAKAKARFGLPADAPVCTCHEAGRDGFWLHRALTKLGITNVVVDASSIEVNRRQKQIKSDPVDAGKLVNMLCRKRQPTARLSPASSRGGKRMPGQGSKDAKARCPIASADGSPVARKKP
jgi:hypothetical protein